MSKPEDTLPDPLQAWSADLVAEVVTPLEPSRTAALAAAATAAVTTAGVGAGTVVAGHMTAKVIAAVVITATLATGIAAATGVLPDPVQSWIADLVDGIGIHLPRPEDVIPIVPTTLPALDTTPLPGITVPAATLP